MIDLSFSEMLLIAVVAIVVIGPKDLPHVMARIGRWVGQGKAMVRQLRHGLDEMVRETELAEMEKRWAEHNRRIMEDHPEEVVAGEQMQPLPPSFDTTPANAEGTGEDQAAPPRAADDAEAGEPKPPRDGEPS